jgi:hypothetical protein
MPAMAEHSIDELGRERAVRRREIPFAIERAAQCCGRKSALREHPLQNLERNVA